MQPVFVYQITPPGVGKEHRRSEPWCSNCVPTVRWDYQRAMQTGWLRLLPF